MKTLLMIIFIVCSFADACFAQSEFDFFPMNIGDERHYFRYTYDSFSGDTIEVQSIRQEKIIGDTVLNNGKKYFVFQRFANTSEFLTYRRIDSTSLKVFEYNENFGCNVELDIFDLSIQNDTNWKDCLGYEHVSEMDTSLVNDLGFDAPKIIDTYVPFGVYIWTLVKGLGPTVFEEGDLGKHDVEYLVYAKVGGKEFGSPTSVQETQSEIPNVCRLMQNYPNPFNPTTTINYFIPRDSNVKVDLFNLSGELVVNLINKKQLAGEHSLQFDGSGLSSGVYVYQLLYGNKMFAKKLVLLK